MARIAYVDKDKASPEVREALEALPPLNIFRTLAHADSAFIPYLELAGVLLARLELEPQLRELVILLVAARTGAEYEWIQHVGISRALGIEEEAITAVQHGELDAACFEPRAQALLRFTAQVVDTPRADDETFDALRSHFPSRQIVEVLLVIGSYHMLARIMTTLDIDLDEAIGRTVIEESHRHLNR
jgi:alkylhydroperoxidase family enzyme